MEEEPKTIEEAEATAKDYFGKDRGDWSLPEPYERFVRNEERLREKAPGPLPLGRTGGEIRAPLNGTPYVAQSGVASRADGKKIERSKPVSVGSGWNALGGKIVGADGNPIERIGATGSTALAANAFDLDAYRARRDAAAQAEPAQPAMAQSATVKTAAQTQAPAAGGKMADAVSLALQRRKKRMNDQNIAGFTAMTMAMQALKSNPDEFAFVYGQDKEGNEKTGQSTVLRGFVPLEALDTLNDSIAANGGKYAISRLMVQQAKDANGKGVPGSETFFVEYQMPNGKKRFENFRIQDVYKSSVKAFMDDGQTEDAANRMVAEKLGDLFGYVKKSDFNKELEARQRKLEEDKINNPHKEKMTELAVAREKNRAEAALKEKELGLADAKNRADAQKAVLELAQKGSADRMELFRKYLELRGATPESPEALGNAYREFEAAIAGQEAAKPKTEADVVEEIGKRKGLLEKDKKGPQKQTPQQDRSQGETSVPMEYVDNPMEEFENLESERIERKNQREQLSERAKKSKAIRNGEGRLAKKIGAELEMPYKALFVPENQDLQLKSAVPGSMSQDVDRMLKMRKAEVSEKQQKEKAQRLSIEKQRQDEEAKTWDATKKYIISTLKPEEQKALSLMNGDYVDEYVKKIIEKNRSTDDFDGQLQ